MNETEREIVAWLRDDARRTEIDARRILGHLINLQVTDAEDWAKLVAMKHGLADAIERGDHRQHSSATVKDSQ